MGIDVILQVPPDAREMMHDRDVVRGKHSPVPHTGEHEQLGRIDRAAGENNLACLHIMGRVTLLIGQPRGATVLYMDTADMGMGLEPQIAARPGPAAERRSQPSDAFRA